jgi:gliding motility-associated-like protein/uncharacterized repeat protein (TIGR01451 family)
MACFFEITEFGTMKKYLNKVCRIAALALALGAGGGVGTAMGADPDTEIYKDKDTDTVRGVRYKIAFRETTACWFNDYQISNYSKDNTIRIYLDVSSPSTTSSVSCTYDTVFIKLSSFGNITNVTQPSDNFDITHSNDLVCIVFNLGELDSKGNRITITTSLIESSISSYNVSAAIKEQSKSSINNTITPIPMDVRRAAVPSINVGIQGGANSKDIDGVLTIEVADTVKYPHYYVFTGDTAFIIGSCGDSIGWKKAIAANNLVPTIKPSLPAFRSRVFKAQDASAVYKYEYKYTESFCELDTTLSVSVWIKKKYIPVLKPMGNNNVSQIDVNAASCLRKYAVSNLPYVKDIAENGNPIDTIQIDEVIRYTIKDKKGTTTDTTLKYNSGWNNSNLADSFSLADGHQYTVKYAYRYKYAHADSVAYESVEIDVPYYIRAYRDTAGMKNAGLRMDVFTDSATKINVLWNDTLSKCLREAHTYRVEVLKTPDGSGYGTTGVSFRGGKLKVDGDTMVVYTSAPNFQGIDTFIYQIRDTSEYGKTMSNVAFDTVIVRVAPLYELSVSKAVDSVVNRKGVRRAGDPNLDSMFVGDTAHFTITVKNVGKNSIIDDITVTDTLPDHFNVLPGAPALTPKVLQWKVKGSNTNADTLGVNSVHTISYALVAHDTATSPPDTNRVHVAVRLLKNTFEFPATGSAGDSTTAAHSDTLLLRVYESIDVAFTQAIDTSTSGLTPPFTDTLRCDSLYQRAAFVLTATNVGNTPLLSVTVVDTLSAGMALSDTAYFLINKNGNKKKLTGFKLSMTKTPLAADTVYTWAFTDIHIGTDSALQVVLYATVDTLGTFGSRGYAFAPGKMDIDSADNYSDTVATVIFQPEITLDIQKVWEKYPHVSENKYIGVNSVLKFTITATNSSALPLRNVVVRDTLHTPYLYKKAGMPAVKGEVWKGDSVLTWTIPHLGSGANADLSFYVTATTLTDTNTVADDPDIPNSVSNVAHAYLPLYYGSDSVYSDSSPHLKIQSGIDLEMEASIVKPYIKVENDMVFQQQGDTIKLKLKVINTSSGESVADTVRVQVVFPDKMLMFADTLLTPGSAYDPSKGIWTIPDTNPATHDPKLGIDNADSITITLIALDTGYVYESKKEVRGYIIGYKPVCLTCADNDTAFAPTLRIVENPVDLWVTKKVCDTVYLSNKDETIRDSITIFTYKSPIGGIRLVDSLPPNVNHGSVDLSASTIPLDIAFDVGSGRYVVKTKNPVSLPAETDSTIVVSYTVSTEGSYFSVVHVKCDSVEATRSNNVAYDTTVVLPMVNLKVALTATAGHPSLVDNNAAKVMEGDTITYTLVVSHEQGSYATATDVTLAFDPIPAGSIAFIRATLLSDGRVVGVANASAGVKFDKISVPVGQTDTIVALARVKSNTANDEIEWRAYLSCKNDMWHDNDTTKANEAKLTVVDNPNDASVSITPVDTFFYLSAATGAPGERTPEFTDSIRVKNNGTEALKGITVRYYYKPAEFAHRGSIDPPPAEQAAGMLKWTIDTIAVGGDTTITISGCDVPYDHAGRYARSVTVSTQAPLEADPLNNTAEATVRVIYDVDLVVDSLQLLLNQNVSASYTQGDTIAVCVKLTNQSGKKSGYNVQVWVTDTSGFIKLESSPHKLQDILAPGGALYDTLRFVVDTFTAPGDSIRLRVAASADTSATKPTFTVRDSSGLSLPFVVQKGADAAVWLEEVQHKAVYYANLSYTIAVANLDRYKATGVALHHAVPDSFSIDSVRILNSSAGIDTTLVAPVAPPSDSLWSLETIRPNAADTVRVTFYVTLDVGDSTKLSIDGYIACRNDNNVHNDTIGNVATFEGSLKITKNPYHLKVTKTAAASPYSSLNEDITYFVEVSNVGDSAAYGLKITDTIPRTIALLRPHELSAKDTVYLDTMHSSADSVIIVWMVDTLRPDESDTLTFYARAHEAGQIHNTAQIVAIDTGAHSFDPDPKNRRDHTDIDTTDVTSDQRITITPSTYKWVIDSLGARWARVDTFTQGDTIRLTITVSKTNSDEKALGIKITLDTMRFRDGTLSFVEYDDSSQHLLSSAFNDTTLVWTLDLDATQDAKGELWLYAVAGSEIPARGELLDSIELYIYVEDTSIYYPQIGSSSNETAKIYVEYCDLDLKVEVQVSPTEHPQNPKAVYPGGLFDYRINIVNLREALLSTDSVTLVDTLPSGITCESVGPVQYDTSYKDANGRTILRWNNLNSYLAGAKDGEIRQLMLQNCKESSFSSFGCYPNKAQILVNRHEATLSNNSSEDTACVVSPVSFNLTFAAQRDTVTQGDEQELYLTITNYSESTQSDLCITAADIPSQLRFVKSDKGGSVNSAKDTFTWYNSSENLASDSSLTITLTVQAADTGAAAWRAALHTGGNKGLGVDTVRVYVKKNPYNVKLTKTASKSVFYRDETAPYKFEYKIKVKNTGEEPVTDVAVRDTLPRGIDTVDFAANNPTATVEVVEPVDGEIGGERLSIAFGSISSLQPGDSTELTFSCQAKDTGVAAAYLNRAYATSSVGESSRDDNTDTALVEVRNVVNLKLQMALCTKNGTEYPSDHKYLQGDEIYVKVSVMNNGKTATTNQTYVTITPSDYGLGNFSFTSLASNLSPSSSSQPQSFLISSGKCGNFTIGAKATTTHDAGSETINVEDSATVAFSILPGADMEVKIAVASPSTSHATDRKYTIFLKNRGQYRADTVKMSHKLDTSIVSLDSVRLRPFGQQYYGEIKRISASSDTLYYEPQNNELLIYSRADKTLTYSRDAVAPKDSAEMELFVTTAKPSAETVLKIYPFAEVSVFSDWDKALGNNRAYSETPIEVHPNPYNVSISIAPERADKRYTPDVESISQEYTITAKNIGKRPAEGRVTYSASAGLVITEHTQDNLGNADTSNTLSWTIIPQLLAGYSTTFSVTVEPENRSVKGHKPSIVNIDPVFLKDATAANPETDLGNNSDTAYLNLFSVLQSWTLMEAFSPNGDGKNDRFVIHDLESDIIERAEIVIVNRYGSEVYYHRNYKEAQRDESMAFTGAGLPEGSYFYQLTVYFADRSADKRGGAITIRRSRWK